MTELNGFLSSKKNYMVVGSGNEIISNIKCQILTVIPNSVKMRSSWQIMGKHIEQNNTKV